MDKAKLIDKVRSEMCDSFCKWPTVEPPEGKTEGWLFEDGSPCDRCPMAELDYLLKEEDK